MTDPIPPLPEWIKIAAPPGYAGGYYVGGSLYFALVKKPCLFHRLFTRMLLGWVWKDAP